MAETTAARAPERDLPDRYLVLADGETWGPLKGSKVIEIADALEGDDIDAAIKARCQHADPQEKHDDEEPAGSDDREEARERPEDDDEKLAAGITVLYTANGYEPGLAEGQTTPGLTGVLDVVAAAPKATGEIRGERRTIVLHFLGDPHVLADPDSDLGDLLARADTGDLVLDVACDHREPVDGPTLARFAREAGSEAGFFQLTDDGERADDLS